MEEAAPAPGSKEWIYRKVAQIVDGVVAETCGRHYPSITQEHQFTSKLAEALEREIRGLQVGGLQIHVQDFPDKGAGAMEKKSGADLYISVVLETAETTINKGMLVQAKWDDALSSSKKELDAQQDKMLNRTEAAYVWIYEPRGIAVVPAGKIRAGKFRYEDAGTIGELISNGLRCTAGDPELGRNLDQPVAESLESIMRELSIGHAIAFTVGLRGVS